jgi:Pyruvate/2-oxoacid:ferredoxin oxidoreductase gamma subunit
MEKILSEVLPTYTNITVDIRRGLTHTGIRVNGDSTKLRKPGFQADVYIYHRTQEVSISRIDNKDDGTLKKIVSVVSGFSFR